MRPSTPIALLALFLALTGGAYAAVKLPANSVGTKQIKKKAVTLAKIAPSAQKALKGATGPQGPKGADGAPGAQGPQGAQGVQGIQGSEGPVAKADANGNIDVATAPESGDTNTIRIGTSTQNRTFIPAIAHDGTGGTDQVFLDGATGRLAINLISSRATKRDIHPLSFSTDRFMRLQPVRYRYRTGDGRVRYGLIAEDVAKVFPQLAVFGSGRRPVALHMDQLPAMLLFQVQRQQRQIARLERRIASLEH
jgi:hypothetical protein